MSFNCHLNYPYHNYFETFVFVSPYSGPSLKATGQLALVAVILHEMFETRNPWLVALICCAFLCLYYAFWTLNLLPFSRGELVRRVRQPSRFWLTAKDPLPKGSRNLLTRSYLGLGGILLRKIEGDYNDVVGFPAASFWI
jgi:hypothetical protein